jgi:hypothetical protein
LKAISFDFDLAIWQQLHLSTSAAQYVTAALQLACKMAEYEAVPGMVEATPPHGISCIIH